MAYNKFRDLDPLVLYKEDLLELEQLFRKVVNCTECHFIIHAKVAGHDLSAEPFQSLEALTQAEFPAHVDQLSISAKEISDNEAITKSLVVEVDKSSGDVRLSHETDSAWVKSAGDQFIAFFKGKRPWYAGIKRVLAPLFNVNMLVSLLLATPALMSGNYWLLIFPVLLFACAGVILMLAMKQVIFPYSRIGLYSATLDQRRNYELWAILAWTGILLISVSSALLFM